MKLADFTMSVIFKKVTSGYIAVDVGDAQQFWKKL